MFGGIFGVTIGASIMSAIELFYFVSGKFLTAFLRKYVRVERDRILERRGPELYWNEFINYFQH